MAEEMTFLPRAELLSLEEIALIAERFIARGVRKIRLSGGEPLVRRDMTATPYQPATASSRLGFSDEQIESNRFRVSFAGNSLTSRETVERYLLYRAAELTVQRGFDHFILVTRDTETKTDTYRTPGAYYGPGPWGYWSPS